MLSSLVKVVNVLIALAFLLAVVAFYWLIWRPLPQTGGFVEGPAGVSGTIARNQIGAVRVEAPDQEQAWFLQGYATAQDRMWQMDGMRRLAAGELAEVAGAAAIDSDREARQWRLGALAKEWERRLTDEERLAVTSYARGVNFYLETHRNRLPLEFQLMRYEPRPWQASDCLLAGALMFKTLTLRWQTDWEKQELLSTGDLTKVDVLYPVGVARVDLPGSNAWVLSGARSKSGKPMLANDMHLGWGIPDTWHMIQLKTPDWQVAGITLPGLPGAIAGHNGRIAWGLTNLGFDTQDLYFEDLDPVRGLYRYKGGIEQARAERSYIRVKDAKPVEVSVWVTRHGPAFLLYQNRYVALRWMAYEAEGEVLPYLRINRATNWEEFRGVLRDWIGPPLNFVYADSENIGYQVAGQLPIRRGFAGDVVLEGAKGETEWDGAIPFDSLPTAFNPESGYWVTANDNSFPREYAYTVSGTFEPGYRARRITELLQQKKKWSAAETLGVQTDTYSIFHHFLAKEIQRVAERSSDVAPEMGRGLEVLRGWDGRMRHDQPGPMVAELLFQHLRTAIAESAAKGKGATYQTRAVSNGVIEHLLRTRPEGWFPDWDRAILAAFESALAEGSRMQGPDPSNWRWGKLNELWIRHPVGNRIPVLDKRYNIGPVALNGCQVCVNQASLSLGPSQRMIVDFGNLDSSLLNIRTGQSGHAFSGNYRDQWDEFYEGKSFPFRTKAFDAEDVLTFRPKE